MLNKRITIRLSEENYKTLADFKKVTGQPLSLITRKAVEYALLNGFTLTSQHLGGEIEQIDNKHYGT